MFHKTDHATKAHLHLALLTYWVVSVTQYQLRRKGIHARCGELLRIMSAQQRVTIVAEQTNSRNVFDKPNDQRELVHFGMARKRGMKSNISVRRSAAPEEKLTAIQNALGIPAKPTCSIKFVWPPKLPSLEDPNSVSAT